MRLTMPAVTIAVLLPLWLAGHSSALAHSGATAEARLDVVVGADDAVQALRHVWRFDEEFTETLLDEFDANGNDVLDPDELKEVSKTIETSIAELGYFQFVMANGEDVAMQPPDQFAVDMQEGSFIVLFEIRPKAPLNLEGTVEIGVFDPTFTTVFDFPRDDYLSLDRLPERCSRRIVRRDEDAVLKRDPQIMDEMFNGEADGGKLARLFATRLKIICSESRKIQTDQDVAEDR